MRSVDKEEPLSFHQEMLKFIDMPLDIPWSESLYLLWLRKRYQFNKKEHQNTLDFIKENPGEWSWAAITCKLNEKDFPLGVCIFVGKDKRQEIKDIKETIKECTENDYAHDPFKLQYLKYQVLSS